MLFAALIYVIEEQKITPVNDSNKLLSSRIYSGILEPQSYLILNYDPLREDITSYIEGNNLNVSVYVENLRDGASMGIHERSAYPPASMSKLPLAILIMKKVENEELTFDQKIPILDEDRNDSSGDLYEIPRTELSIRELLDAMLRESDNTAFNVLLRNANSNDFTTLLDKYYGYFHEAGENDADDSYYVTPIGFYNVFSSLYLSTVLQPQDSEYILQLLTNTSFDIRKTANLPENVTVAHKYGIRYRKDEKYFHDCGIMYIENLRIFYCIMTKDMEQKQAIETTAMILNKIYSYTTKTREELDDYKEGFVEGSKE